MENYQAEPELFEAYQAKRDPELRSNLVSRYFPLVVSLAKHFYGKDSLDDLTQVGTIGLLKAFDAYDPKRNVLFSTYAAHHILGEIRHYLRDKNDLIRHPRWLRKLTFQILSEKEKFIREFAREPSTKEIAERLNIKEDGILEILSLGTSLHWMSLDSVDFDSLQKKIRAVRPATLQLPIEDRIVLENALEKLRKIERKAVDLFFYQDLTQTEIGKKLHLSQRAVSRLIGKSLRNLKAILTQDLW